MSRIWAQRGLIHALIYTEACMEIIGEINSSAVLKILESYWKHTTDGIEKSHSKSIFREVSEIAPLRH